MSRGIGTLLTGAAAFAGGIIAGLLLAPKSGKESRKWLHDQSDEAKTWLEDKSHKILEEGEKRIDRVSEGIKRTVKENVPDLYEATKAFKLEEDDVKDA